LINLADLVGTKHHPHPRRNRFAARF
jgi:hypothetical protein